ncbi:DFP-domain-containing protein [Exidia glandulosa HHB12029]|uniref:DFP-domain-containing protein n=1 Tax=Exidia glandulosa HHB12029 TaxID=1314781 RepID=A0A165JJN4_EXIGL|nr:DFP-domain-containing protein [Exidia glandulosa HHB12029]
MSLTPAPSPPPILSNTKPRKTQTEFSAASYFATQPAPPTLDRDVASAREWVQRQVTAGRRVVLVTSGGTTVPLELNVVRFLDNFSAGTRGATSAEYFLSQGYAVLFMHRQHSLQPYSRHYSHSVHPFLDVLELEHEPAQPEPASPETAPSIPAPTHDQDEANIDPNAQITVRPDTRAHLASVLRAYKRVKRSDALHTVTFVTVNEYLFLLRALAQDALSLAGRGALYYLAAAVSDFFLPTQKMSEHKIQSGKGTLNIEMDQVPKILRPLTEDWSANAFIVSFKLETDMALLLPKARQALDRYGHHLVIGNELHTRKHQVVFVSRAEPDGRWVRLERTEEESGKEIEELIIQELVLQHLQWIAAA